MPTRESLGCCQGLGKVTHLSHNPTSWPSATRPHGPAREPASSDRQVRAFGADSNFAGALAGGSASTVDTSLEQELFISGLSYLVERQASLTPQPFEAQDIRVTSEEATAHLKEQGAPSDDVSSRILYELLHREPSLVGSSHGPNPTDDSWSVEPWRDVRRYKGVNSVRAYLERLDEEYAVPPQPPSPLQRSSLNLLEAIDYLNAIWELRVGGGPLLRFPRGVTANRLVEPCATPEEFQSCLSALSDILKYRIDQHAVPFKRLLGFGDRLDAGSKERLVGAIEVLQAVNSVRVGTQR